MPLCLYVLILICREHNFSCQTFCIILSGFRSRDRLGLLFDMIQTPRSGVMHLAMIQMFRLKSFNFSIKLGFFQLSQQWDLSLV